MFVREFIGRRGDWGGGSLLGFLACSLVARQVYCPGGGREVVKLLVGNKVDKAAEVSRSDAEDWARARGMLFLEASAKTDVGIAQVRTRECHVCIFWQFFNFNYFLICI